METTRKSLLALGAAANLVGMTHKKKAASVLVRHYSGGFEEQPMPGAGISMEEDAQVGAGVEHLRRLVILVEMQLRFEQEIKDLTEVLKGHADRLRTLTEATIPNLFDEIGGLREIVLDDGRRIIVSEEVYPNIKKENQPAAFKWLRDHNFGDLIKNEVKVAFGAGEDAKAIELQAMLIECGFPMGQQKTTVHSMTLGAFVREQLKKGADLPSSIDVMRVRKSVIKQKK